MKVSLSRGSPTVKAQEVKGGEEKINKQLRKHIQPTSGPPEQKSMEGQQKRKCASTLNP